MQRRIFLVLTTLLPLLGLAGRLPAADTLVITGGRLLTISNGVIDPGVLVIEDGIITAVGSEDELAAALPAQGERIDAAGMTVMPGLIDGFSDLGIADIPSFGSDADEASSAMLPQLQVTDAFNPDSRLLARARQAGITTILCAPADGNLLSGRSAVMHLSGDTVTGMTLLDPAGVHCCLGEPAKLRYGGKQQAPMTRMGMAAQLRQILIDALDYGARLDAYQDKLARFQAAQNRGKTRSGDDPERPEPPERDLKLEALLPVVHGELPLIVSVNRFDDLHTALRIAGELDLRLVINHGAEAYRLADRLAAEEIPVILGPSSLFLSRQEGLAAVADAAVRLSEAGVLFAFQGGGFSNPDGLLHEARLAVAHGLPADQALAALTLNPARVFGLDDRLGSLEVGKVADIVIFDGDPLQGTAKATTVLIAGERR